MSSPSSSTLFNLLFKSLDKTIIWPSLPDFVNLSNGQASTEYRIRVPPVALEYSPGKEELRVQNSSGKE